MAEQRRAAWAEDVETHRRIDGRHWRISDPRLPDEVRQALVNELMSARRAVRDASDEADERSARVRVHDAKVALGARGLRWWIERPDADAVDDRIRRTRSAVERTPLTAAGSLTATVAAITSRSQERVIETIDATDGPAGPTDPPRWDPADRTAVRPRPRPRVSPRRGPGR